MNKKADIIEKNAAAAPGDERAITKLCGMLGLAKKAGALIAGAELYMLPIDKERLGDCIGRHSAVGAAALTDPNFGRVFYAMCKSVDPLIYTANKQITTQEVE